ncbi:MAG: hypothetical protein NC344_04900 [Bacteroidales bacterium]|nr:hypothetical protein [Bacteroidales bacterium]MCM1147164.1 hypothetical protein [Bacteroidales bacterium]MCM1205390.1 hypothetical protein [Bacillota bacterium]MCM1509805.1 hypothetical protein [Clostridium sp.]
MIRKLLKQKTFVGLLVIGASMLGACADNDYDFDQIDYTVGLGSGEFFIPVSNTDVIKLEDVLDLDNSNCVVVKDNGDYMFEQTGDDMAPVKVNIDKIVLSQERLETYPFMLDLGAGGAKSRFKVRRTAAVPQQTAEIHVFSYEGESEEVVDLNMVGVERTPVSLVLKFPAGLNNYMPAIDQLTLEFPEFVVFENVQANAGVVRNGNKFTFANVSTAQNLRLNMNITGLDFKTQASALGSATVKNGKIVMTGNVRMTVVPGTLSFNGQQAPSAPFRIDNDLVLGSALTVASAEGKFNPAIDMRDLGKVDITGVPDFLNDGNVVVDLDNPQIILSVANNMEASGIIDGTLTATKKGQAPKVVRVSGIRVNPNSANNICICRKKTADMVAAYGDENIYVVENLTDLIKTIPDNIRFSAVTSADPTRVCRFEFGHDYEIKPSYRVEAPIAFGKDANIVYRDSLLDWHEDIKDLDLTEGAYVEAVAEIENRMPVFLNVSAYAVDVDDNDISDEIEVEVSNSIIASADGETSSVTPVTIRMKQKKQGAMKKIDGLRVLVQGKATSDDGTRSVVGVTLNAEKHFLIARDIRIKLVGKVIADLN